MSDPLLNNFESTRMMSHDFMLLVPFGFESRWILMVYLRRNIR
jgi:hypothetical protein